MIELLSEGLLGFSNSDYNMLTDEAIGLLVDAAKFSRLKRARINFHQPEAQVHEMCICLLRETLLDVHRHMGKSESFNVIEGKIAVVLFESDEPSVVDTVILEAGSYNRYYRLDSPLYHLVIPLSEHVLMLETTSGPFRSGQADIAPWSLSTVGADLVDSIRDTLKRQHDEEFLQD